MKENGVHWLVFPSQMDALKGLIMKKILFLLYILLLGTTVVRAQRVSRDFRNVTMPTALQQLGGMTHRYTINFIYNDLEDFHVTASIRGETIPEAIRHLIGFYPISMTMVGDSIINVECSQKTVLRYKGRVVDDKGEPAEYANVVLLSPADSSFLAGGVSNESGYFVIPCNARRVIAKVTYVGYKSKLWTAASPDLGTIRLQADRYTLKGVTVKTQRPQYRAAKGGMTIDVEHSVLSKMGTAVDVLGQLPRVTASGSDIKVFAKGTPLIYINNKKVTDNRELTELKSENIKNVDVITAPGSQYDATVKSVIRIRTRKPAGEGWSVRNDANAKYNTMWAGYDQATIKYRIKGLELSNTSFLYSQVFKENIDAGYTLMPKDNIINIDQHFNDAFRQNVLSQTFRLSYDFNANNSIGGSYSFYKTLSNNMDANSNQTVTRNSAYEGSILQSQRQHRDVGPRNEANLYYTGKLGNWSIDFNASYLHMKYMLSQQSTENSTELGNRDVASNGGQRSDLWAGKLVVTYPVGKGTLSFGSEYTHTKSVGFYVNNENYVPASSTKLCEANIAGFADFSLPFGHYELNAGLRYEHVTTDYYSFGKREQEPSRRYGNIFPNLSLSWDKNLWSWQLSYTMKTSRPGYNNLRNFMQYDSRYLYEGGNPYLRPEYTHNVELSFEHKWLSASVDYDYVHKPMLHTFGLYDNQEIAYFSVHNMGHYQMLSAAVTASPTFSWYQPSWAIDYSQLFFREPTSLCSRHPSFTFELRNSLVFPHGWMAGIDFYGYTDSYKPMRRTAGLVTVDARLRKSFFQDRLVFLLQASDLTKSNRERWTYYGTDVISRKDANNFTRNISLTVTYNFNATRSRYKGTGAGNEEKKRL